MDELVETVRKNAREKVSKGCSAASFVRPSSGADAPL